MLSLQCQTYKADKTKLFLIKCSIFFCLKGFFFPLAFHSRCLLLSPFCTAGIGWSGPRCLCRFSFIMHFFHLVLSEISAYFKWVHVILKPLSCPFSVVHSMIVSQSQGNIVAAFFGTNFRERI